MGPRTPVGTADFSIPYVAGVIDCRGHVEISLRHDKPQPRVSVTTRRIDVLLHLAAITGTKVSEDTRGYERRPCGEHCDGRHQHVVRQSAKWRVDSARATVVLWNVLPHVVGQVDKVRNALLAGLAAWPALRGDTGRQMARLGWELPPVRGAEVQLERMGTSVGMA